MKKLFVAIIMLCSIILHAQQTFFTIPSGEITHRGKIFYQFQNNFLSPYIQGTQAKFDFCYGIGHHWELGFNLDTELSWKKNHKFFEIEDTLGINPVTPLLLFNMQKGIPLLPHPKLRLNIGTQAGTNLIHKDHLRFAYMGYVMLASEFKEDWHTNIGVYVTNDAFAGKGSHIDVFGGIEIPFSERWAIMADATLGSNSNCIGTFGFSYNPTNRMQLCLGGIAPMPNNPIKEYGVVFELSVFGWDFWDKNED
jgi:hypothetical protein